MRSLVSLNHFLGGALGLLTSVLLLPQGFASPFNFVVVSALVNLHALAIGTAVLLQRGSSSGYRLSLLLNTIQLFQISAAVVDIAFIQGLYVSLVAGDAANTFKIGFVSTGNLYFSNGLPWAVGVNLVAAAFVLWALHALRCDRLSNSPMAADIHSTDADRISTEAPV